jgi:hypothetical protein
MQQVEGNFRGIHPEPDEAVGVEDVVVRIGFP